MPEGPRYRIVIGGFRSSRQGVKIRNVMEEGPMEKRGSISQDHSIRDVAYVAYVTSTAVGNNMHSSGL